MGDITSVDLINVDDLVVLQDGVGDINLDNIDANTIYARMSDVGNINLVGIADEVSYRMDGVGSVRAFDLEAKIGDVELDGVGDIEVNASDDLTINHDGVGKVYYVGNPDLHITGEGGNIVGVN